MRVRQNGPIPALQPPDQTLTRKKNLPAELRWKQGCADSCGSDQCILVIGPMLIADRGLAFPANALPILSRGHIFGPVPHGDCYVRPVLWKGRGLSVSLAFMDAIVLRRLRTVLCAPDCGDRDEPPRSRSVQGTCDTMKKISSLASRAMDSLLDHLLTLKRPCPSFYLALRCIIPGAIGGANSTCNPDRSSPNMFMLVMQPIPLR